MSALIRRLCEIRRDALFTCSSFSARTLGETVIAEHRAGEKRMIGCFCTKGRGGVVSVDLPDGEYRNLMDDSTVRVDQGHLALGGEPVIVKSETA